MAHTSLRQYALSRKDRKLPGQSLSAVQRAIESDRLVKSVHRDRAGRIVGVDPEMADVEWIRNTDDTRRPFETNFAEATALQARSPKPAAYVVDQALIDSCNAEMREYLTELCAKCCLAPGLEDIDVLQVNEIFENALQSLR